MALDFKYRIHEVCQGFWHDLQGYFPDPHRLCHDAEEPYAGLSRTPSWTLIFEYLTQHHQVGRHCRGLRRHEAGGRRRPPPRRRKRRSPTLPRRRSTAGSAPAGAAAAAAARTAAAEAASRSKPAGSRKQRAWKSASSIPAAPPASESLEIRRALRQVLPATHGHRREGQGHPPRRQGEDRRTRTSSASSRSQAPSAARKSATSMQRLQFEVAKKAAAQGQSIPDEINVGELACRMKKNGASRSSSSSSSSA